MRSHSSAPELNKQNPREKTLHLPFFFRFKHIPPLKNLPSPAPNESLPYWFQGNFAASFVLNFCLKEFLLSTFANRFELRCEPKRLMLLYYKICPCWVSQTNMVQRLENLQNLFCQQLSLKFLVFSCIKGNTVFRSNKNYTKFPRGEGRRRIH